MRHSFDTALAARFGVNAALVFSYIEYCCHQNMAEKKNIENGRAWVRCSAETLVERYDYLSKKQIYLALQKLVDGGVVVKKSYSESSWDNASWYTLADDAMEVESEPAEVDENPEKPRENACLPKGDVDDYQRGTSTTTKGIRRRDERDTSTCQKGYVDDPQRDTSYIIPSIPESITPFIPPTSTTPQTPQAEEAWDNPFGGGGDERPNFNTVEAYIANNIPGMNARNLEEAISFLDDLPEDILRYAVDKACERNARNWAYVKAILNRIIASGQKTLAEVKAADDAYTKARGQPISMTAAVPRNAYGDPDYENNW